jgi:hypothetical protein
MHPRLFWPRDKEWRVPQNDGKDLAEQKGEKWGDINIRTRGVEPPECELGFLKLGTFHQRELVCTVHYIRILARFVRPP